MKNKFKQKGFGIIEVLVSAVLLMIVVGSVIGLGRMALRNNVLSTQRTQAFNLAREKAESIINLRNENWIGTQTNITWTKNIIPSTTISFPYKTTETITKDNVTYTRETTISQIANNQFNTYITGIDRNDAYNIKVIVSWYYASQQYSVNDVIMITNWKPRL